MKRIAELVDKETGEVLREFEVVFPVRPIDLKERGPQVAMAVLDAEQRILEDAVGVRWLPFEP